MNLFKSAVLASMMAFGLSGCASMISGEKDTLVAKSLDKEAMIYVDGDYVGKQSATFVKRRGHNSVIEARKEGCITGAKKTDWNFDPTSLLGILIDWGIVSIPLDFAIGGAMKPDADTYIVDPICE